MKTERARTKVRKLRVRKCKGCDQCFKPSRPNQEYHTAACRKNRYERTPAGRERKARYSDSLLGTISQVKPA